MEIKKIYEDENTLRIGIEGRLDTMTAPELENFLKQEIGERKSLDLDLQDLEYISSAGLRVILSAQKVMNRQGNMVLRNVREEVMDVFEITGFVDILTIQ